MKKITSLFLSVALVLCALLCSGCSKELTFNEIIENTSALDAVEAIIKTEVSMGAENFSVTVPVTVDMKAKGLTGESPVVWAKTTTSMFGESMITETYTEGEYIYFKSDDFGSYKMKVADIGDEYDTTGDFSAMLQNLPEDLLENTEITKNEDGTRTITLSIPDEKFSELFGDLAKDISESLAEAQEGEDADLALANAVVTVTVADKYVKKYEIEFTMEIDFMGIQMSAETSCSVEIVKTGDDVTVTPPEGYEDFEDLTIDPDFGF